MIFSIRLKLDVRVSHPLMVLFLLFVSSCRTPPVKEKQPSIYDLPVASSDIVIPKRKTEPLKKAEPTPKEKVQSDVQGSAVKKTKPLMSVQSKTPKGRIIKTEFYGDELVRETRVVNKKNIVTLSIRGNATIDHDGVLITAPALVVEESGAYGSLVGGVKVYDRANGLTLHAASATYDKGKHLVSLNGLPYMIVQKDKQPPIQVTCNSMFRNLEKKESSLFGDVRIFHDGWTILGDQGTYFDDKSMLRIDTAPVILGNNQFLTGDHLDYYSEEKRMELEGSVIHLARSSEDEKSDSKKGANKQPSEEEENKRLLAELRKMEKNSPALTKEDRELLQKSIASLTNRKEEFSRDKLQSEVAKPYSSNKEPEKVSPPIERYPTLWEFALHSDLIKAKQDELASEKSKVKPTDVKTVDTGKSAADKSEVKIGKLEVTETTCDRIRYTHSASDPVTEWEGDVKLYRNDMDLWSPHLKGEGKKLELLSAYNGVEILDRKEGFYAVSKIMFYNRTLRKMRLEGDPVFRFLKEDKPTKDKVKSLDQSALAMQTKKADGKKIKEPMKIKLSNEAGKRVPENNIKATLSSALMESDLAKEITLSRGNVNLQEKELHASAEQAIYFKKSDLILLEGDPVLHDQARGEIRCEKIILYPEHKRALFYKKIKGYIFQ